MKRQEKLLQKRVKEIEGIKEKKIIKILMNVYLDQ